MLENCPWRVCDVRWMLAALLETVEGEFYLLEAVEVLEVMRCVLLCILEAVEGGSVYWRRWRCWRWRLCAVMRSVG